MNTDIFSHFINIYVKKDQQERIRFLVDRPKRHMQLVNEFKNSTIFKKGVLHEIPKNQQTPDAIYNIMSEKNNLLNCFEMLDIVDGPLQPKSFIELLKQCVGKSSGTILFCPNLEIGYFEGSHSKDRFILKK